MTPALRHAIGRVLGRSILITEDVQATIDDLDAYVSERQRAGVNVWQFSDVPELVVQVVDSSGQRVCARLAGGTGTAIGSTMDDPTARAYIRALLRLAEQHLDNTEPTSAIGAAP